MDLDAIRKAEATEGAMTRLQIRPGTLVLVYAGILGHAQGLEVIMDAALRLKDRTDVLFLLIGEGPDRVMLQELQAQRGLANVRFLGRIDRAEVLAILKESDAVVVPLRRNDLFLGAIPSKVFLRRWPCPSRYCAECGWVGRATC
ncbi:MAG: glycosyltransferase, partial [Flavobacteriales bacterium]|nr:glycosyltransferase [Flavobacteriales bacterium]